MTIFSYPQCVVQRFAKRLLLTLGILIFNAGAFAGNQLVRINEIMAGLNGDSAIQFVELFVPDESQKQWGPQASELVGRVILVFFDGAGNQTGRYIFPSDPAPGALSVLVATQEFADLTGITPDFIMPKGVMPIAGKVSFRNNPDAGAAGSSINLCLSYGGTAFTGNTEGAGPANAANLSILNSQSLRRTQNFGTASFGSSGQLNVDFALGTPTPSSTRAAGSAGSIEHNLLGEAVLPVADIQSNQGKNLFLRETFLGNSRTCATCHSATDQFSLPPAKVASLPNSDPLFINENNVNTLVVNSAGSVLPTAGSGSTQPSDFVLNGIITGNLGGSAKVLSGSGNTYLIIGGGGLNIPGNVLSDVKGDKGTLVSFTPGNLNGPTPSNTDPNGLENSALLRGVRVLILENINGFSQNGFMRGSPSLINVKFTAPYGLSGEFPDLQSFSANAVRQHFTRSLNRVVGTDFRVPTPEELDALAAFQNSLVSPADENFDETHQFDRFLTTASQRAGRDGFFGPNKCSTCHGGKALSTSNGQFGTTLGVNESFNTGVVNLLGGVPTEQDAGQPANSRKFNVPALFGVKNTGPFFHDGSAATLLDAIVFYDSGAFVSSPAFAQVGFIPIGNASDIRDFLEAVVGQPNSLPTINGVAVGQPINDNATLMPFSGVTIGDADTPAQTLVVTVKMDNAAKGRFSALSGFNDLGDGIVSFSGTAAAATTAIRGLEFDPTDDRVPAGATETTTFVITINDSVDAAVVNSTTTVVATAVHGAAGISRIGTQFVVVDTATAAIPFTLSGLDPASGSFALTGSSSNPGLVPNANIVFGGSGKNRTVALTPLASQIGMTTITVSANDGAKSASRSFLLIVGQSALDSIIVPNQVSTSEGDSVSGPLNGDIRIQEIYGATHFQAGILLITEIRFRRDANQPPLSLTLPGTQFNLSTTPTAPDNLTANFASNVGPDDTLIYSGSLTISSPASGQVGGLNSLTPSNKGLAQTTSPTNSPSGLLPPGTTNLLNAPVAGASSSVNPILTSAAANPFDIVVPLTTPFVYNSTVGNLLLEMRNFTSASAGFFDAAASSSDSAARAHGPPGASSTVAGASDTVADVVQFTFTLINAQPTISDIGDQITQQNIPTGAIAFTVGDAETSAANLTLTSGSSNPSLLPNGNIVFGGSAGNRTVSLTPAPGQRGIAVVTITVHDDTLSASDTFVLVVGPLPPTISDIPDRTISLTVTSPAVAFTVGDLDTTLNSLTLSASSSNPSLLPAGNVVFSGAGAARTLTLTPTGPNEGQATVTVTVSDGALTASDTFVVTVERVFVLPPGNDSTPGNSASGALIAPIHLQNLYHASLFPASPILIKRLSFRANEGGTPPLSGQIPRLQISLSSTPAAPDALSTSFTANLGADNTLVFDGPLTINSAGATGPNAGLFDISISLTIPFVYSPSSGNLLVDIQNFSSGLNFSVDSASSGSDLSSRVGSTSPSIGQFVDSVADVIQFQYDFAAGPFPPVISAIADQSWSLGATAQTLNFVVADIDTALNNLALSVTSSNPALISGSNIVFGGSGANRTLTLTPIALVQGQTTITVTVSDGALSATKAFVVTVANKLVVPAGLGFVEGNAASGTLIAPIRLQNLYHASLFPAFPIRITHVSFRAEQGTSSFSSQIPSLQINMSTTTTAPDALSTTFAANHGANNTQVFNGPLTINTAGALVSPGAFDIIIPLSTPFLYAPSSGNLLVDVQNFSSGPAFFVDTAFNPNDLSSRVWNTTAAVGQFADTHADVIQFTYQPANLSPTISSLPDRTIVEDMVTSISFSIGDAETPIGLLTLTGTSSNHSLVPDANLAFAGSGANRSVVITPSPNRSGSTTITLSVADGGGATASISFLLTVLADADGDQVPDDFEVANGMDRLNPADAAQDLDGDGFSNLEEFLLGTDPRAASGDFEISNTQPNGTDLQITFNSVAGKTYRFERSDVSPVGPWTAISDVVGNGGTLQATDVGGAAQAKRFYHIVLLP